MCTTNLTRHNKTEALINCTNSSLIVDHRTAILDFEVSVGEVVQTLQVGNPSGGVPVEIYDWELPISQFRDGAHHEIRVRYASSG